MRKTMKKLFALVAIAGLAFSTLGCAGSSPPPAAPEPAPQTDNTPAPDAAAPAEPAPPAEDKK
jgi:hypothetical protein